MFDLITKSGSFNLLQSRASVTTRWVQLCCITKRSGITKQGRYYKVGPVLQSVGSTTKGSIIYLSIEKLFLRFPEKLNFFKNYKKEKRNPITPTTITDVFVSLVSLRNNPSEVFLVLKTAFIKFLENFQEFIQHEEWLQ